MTNFLIHLAGFIDVLPHAQDPPQVLSYGMAHGPPDERPRRPRRNNNKARTGH